MKSSFLTSMKSNQSSACEKVGGNKECSSLHYLHFTGHIILSYPHISLFLFTLSQFSCNLSFNSALGNYVKKWHHHNGGGVTAVESFQKQCLEVPSLGLRSGFVLSLRYCLILVPWACSSYYNRHSFSQSVVNCAISTHISTKIHTHVSKKKI